MRGSHPTMLRTSTSWVIERNESDRTDCCPVSMSKPVYTNPGTACQRGSYTIHTSHRAGTLRLVPAMQDGCKQPAAAGVITRRASPSRLISATPDDPLISDRGLTRRCMHASIHRPFRTPFPKPARTKAGVGPIPVSLVCVCLLYCLHTCRLPRQRSQTWSPRAPAARPRPWIRPPPERRRRPVRPVTIDRTAW